LAQDLSIIFQVSASVGLEEETIQYVTYPNPATEGIIISPSPSKAMIYNMTGEQWELHKQNEHWDISHLPPGAYILQAFNDNGIPEGTTRMIIQ
jgi:hypothetical protein